MPYITPKQRQEIKTGAFPRNPGELNFALSDFISKANPQGDYRKFFKLTLETYVASALKRTDGNGKLRYVHINELMGVVVSIMLELRRRRLEKYILVLGQLTDVAGEWYDRVAGPYEDTKIAENGDVF